MIDPTPNDEKRTPELEHTGPIWTHPYMIYIVGTTLLFLIVVLAGWWAWTHDIIPHR